MQNLDWFLALRDSTDRDTQRIYKSSIDAPFQYLLLKLAARCNISCNYCYWFRDSTVYNAPSLLDRAVEIELIRKLDLHIQAFALDSFSILFHGGEPLLFGKRRFRWLCQSLRGIAHKNNTAISLAITTNGLLVDQAWSELFDEFEIAVTISIDGPERVHDAHRRTFKGQGTHRGATQAIDLLRKNNISPGLLAVCDPLSSPVEVYDYFTDVLAVNKFDVLVPDATRGDNPASISGYYIELFDKWFNDPRHNIEIRFFKNILQAMFGGTSNTEGIGYGPVRTISITTDGAIQPLDVLRIIGDGSTQTPLNIRTHSFEDLKLNALWIEVLKSTLYLPPQCDKCRFSRSCGGGHIASRYGATNRFNNPSVYCHDYFKLMSHMWNVVSPHITVLKNA